MTTIDNEFNFNFDFDTDNYTPDYANDFDAMLMQTDLVGWSLDEIAAVPLSKFE